MFPQISGTSPSSKPRSIAFVDNGISDADSLIEGLSEHHVIQLPAEANGIEAITQALSKYQNLESIHILSHGENSSLQLGNATLSQAFLNEYQNDLESWGEALNDTGDLLFYGCNFAATAESVEFVEHISHVTQADVAASNDTTGHANGGGDWDLEVTTGEISESLTIEDYQGILPTYNGKNYQLTTGAKSWKEAQAEAISLGGSLVTINSAAEQQWLRDTFGNSERLWIGLTDKATEGQFQWANGEAVTYTNWAPGEPNDYKFGGAFPGGEDYTVMNWNASGQWNDTPDNYIGTFRGIIEVPETSQTFTYNGKEYQLTTKAKSWKEAQAEAQAIGGSLVTINDAAEQQWLHDTFGTSQSFWIGLTDEATEGQFQWANGEAVTYTNWFPNEPNDYKFGGAFPGGEDYTLMNWGGTGKWNDAPDSYMGSYQGIIELPGDASPPNVIRGNSGRIEAENAVLGGSAGTNTNHIRFSGNSFVDGFTQQGASTTFTVNVAEGGLYNTTLRYSNGPNGPSINGTKNLSVYVNGVDVTQTQLASTSTWKKWDNKTEILNLNAGQNTISYRYDSDDTGWVNLDYLWLSKSVSNGPVGTPINTDGLTVEVEKIAQLPNDSTGNPARMIGMTTQGQRLFAYEERDGHIYELTPAGNGTKNTSLFFDVGAAVFANTGRNINTANVTHGGLKGVAFHPNFVNNGKFYTSIMEDRPSNSAQFKYLSDVPNPIQADAVVVEWTYNFQLNQVNANSYREVVRIGMPVFDHPIKEIIFNRFAQPGDEDYGLLYITHGDGSVQSATAGGGLRNDALGKILRINPLQNGNNAYSVPSSNPFVGNNVMLDEVYSLGHRNPHTISFAQDAQGKSHLLVGEAGRDNIEEINVITPGGNYGWSEREGTFVHRPEGGGIIQGLEPLPEDDAKNGYVYPAAQWGHNGSIGAGFVGQAVAGGYVGLPGSALAGQYLFGDFATSGQLYYSPFSQLLNAVTTLDPNDPSRDNPSELTQATIGKVGILFDHDNNDNTAALVRTTMKDVLDDESTYIGGNRADIRFGQGPNGEIYVLNKRNGYVYLVNSSEVG